MCVVTDAHGAVITGSGKQWNTPIFIDRGHVINALSCASMSACLAIDELGRTFTYDGSTWAKGAKLEDGEGMMDLSCADPTSCLAITGSSVFSYDGLEWSNEGSIPTTNHPYTSVSCASPSLCGVGDARGRVVTWNGTAWSPWHVITRGNHAPTDVACPSPTICVAVAGSNASRFEGGAWTDASAGSSLHALSCPTPSYCFAFEKLKDIAVYEAGQWTSTSFRVRGVGIFASACGSQTRCFLLSQSGFGMTWDGSRWGQEVLIDQPTKPFSDLSCPSADFCAITDGVGQVLTLQDGTWSKPRSFYQTLGNPLKHRPHVLSCSTSGVCMGVATGEGAYFDGSSWTEFAAPTPYDYGTAAACVSASVCLGAYDNGMVYPYDGSSWGTGSLVAGGLVVTDLSCATTQLCIAVLQDGSVSRYDGSTWQAPTRIISSGVSSVSCPAASFCAAISTTGEETEFDGTAWSDPVVVDPKGGDVRISCSSADFCVAADTHGFVVTKS